MSVPQPSGAISFQCPHCGQQTEVEAQFAGKSGPCAGCSKPISIPTLESLAPESVKKTSGGAKSWILKTAIGVGVVTALVLVGVVGVAVVRPVLQAAREASQCSECESNLLIIGRALEDFYDLHGHYPPAVIRDDNGKAMHSWRVLILPHLGPEAQLLHKKYDMEKPWDSKENLLLTDQMPNVYKCPSDPNLVQNETSYLAVVGDRTVINRAGTTVRTGSGPFAITDRLAETLVLIESKNSGVHWAEPVDIPAATLRAGLNSRNPRAPGSEHSHGVNTLMADGTVIRLPDYTSSADLRGMATIDGGDEYIEVLDEILYE